jgi:DNA-binding NtrC family response regulator
MAPADAGLATIPTDGILKGNLVRQLKLVVVDGQDAGLRKHATGDRVVIGKHESCDVVLCDDTVSRFHCDVTIEGGRAVVRDLESRNGTLLDGVAVMRAYARSGSILTLGATRIRLDLGGDHVVIPQSEHSNFGGLVGGSSAMRKTFALLERAAASDATVLIEGETGTGKEEAAEAIHAQSARRDHPMLAIDCSAIPPDQLESELFGHERGAFTGALDSHQGAFEATNGGTIFLDEIGELVPDLQPKLLRVLERRVIKRVGANHHLPVDVRIIAATNRNLRAEVNAGRFRPDLFFRLAVVTVQLPPLRAIREDMPLIVNRILDRLGVSETEAHRLRSPEFMAYLASHGWPGNVRELRNYLERCITLDTPVTIGDDTRPLVDARIGLKEARESWNLACERVYVEELLKAHDNNVSAAARASGVDRRYFHRLLWRHKLR